MASTAQERISLMDQALYNDPQNKDLLKQIIRLKLADGVKYKTVEDYLINDYHDNIEFDAEKLKPLLVERANQTKKNYLAGLDELIADKFNDPQYSEQLPNYVDENGKVVTRSFIDVLKDKEIGAINLDNGTLKHGPKTLTIDELYIVFMTNNVLNVELYVQNIVSDAIEELSEKNSYDEEAIYSNNQLTTMLFEDLVHDIINSGAPLTNTEISSRVADVLSKNVQKTDNKNEVEKLEKKIFSGVPDVPEIAVDNFGVTATNSDKVNTEQVTEEEKDALLAGFSYSEQKNAEKIVDSAPQIQDVADQIKNSGPEDDDDEVEIEAGDGVEEETVYLNKVDPSQINDGELEQTVGRAR